MSAADSVLAKACQAEVVELKRKFHELQQSLSPNHRYKYFLTVPDGRSPFWIRTETTPDNGPLAGIVRFREDSPAGDTKADGGYWDKIPSILRKRPQWIWLSPTPPNNNQNGKKPYLCRGVTDTEGLLQKNWLQFSPPLNVGTDVSGIAYVLTNEIIQKASRLVAIVISKECGYSYQVVLDIWGALGRPYLEHSFDGNGWTILGLTKNHVPFFEGQGIKISSTDGYVELCGLGAIGELRDITDEISSVEAYRVKNSFPQHLLQRLSPETPRAVATLKQQLEFISADCDYGVYIQVVWAILSTGWSCAENVALQWSKTAPHRFEQQLFDDLVRHFNPGHPKCPTRGSIYHHARLGGWRG